MSAVDGILSDAWRTGNPEWDSFLQTKGTEEDKSAIAGLMSQIKSLYNDAVHGSPEAPAPAAPTQPTGTYLDQSGNRVERPLGQAGFVTAAGPHGEPTYQFRTREGAPLSEAQRRSDQQTSDFFNKTGKFAPSQQPAASISTLAPVLPPAATRVGDAGRAYASDPNTTFSPYGTVSRNPNTGSSFQSNVNVALQPPQGAEQIKISNPLATGVQWEAIPPSPLDQQDRRRYASF